MREKIIQNPLPILFFTVFVDMLGFGILIPILPQFFANPSSTYFLLPAGFSLRQGYILLGLLLTAFPLSQFIAAPILGQLSDKYGRKKVLALSISGTCISYVIFIFGIWLKNVPLLFFARAMDGFTGGNIAVAQASVADITAPNSRAKNFGLIGSAFGLGFILGPYIGGKLSDPAVISWFGATTPFWFAALLSFCNVIFITLILPETHKTRFRSLRIDWSRSIRNIIRAFNLKELRPLFGTAFLFQSGFSFYVTFFSVFLILRFGFTQGNIGDFFSYLGMWTAFTQAVITRMVAARFVEERVLRVSLIAGSIGMMFYFLPSVWWGLLFVVPFVAIPNGLTQNNLAGLISKSADTSIQGEVLGIYASVQALGQSIPAFLSGFIAAAITPEAPIAISAIVMSIAALVFYIFYRPQEVFVV